MKIKFLHIIKPVLSKYLIDPKLGLICDDLVYIAVY
uniref:Uncharacterized protein n=1 Tax=uncultured Sphingobacteriia bacterium TaxID=246143 RepID=F4MM05_9BACT|nr:hypothetical protein S3_858_0031 [uncultured Sphingobacteriia bacterium]